MTFKNHTELVIDFAFVPVRIGIEVANRRDLEAFFGHQHLKTDAGTRIFHALESIGDRKARAFVIRVSQVVDTGHVHEHIELDAGFFRGSEDNPRTRIVVSEALALAKSLNMKTVAEGVEDKSTVDFLAQEGCDMIQGYYFAKPMPQAEYENTVIPVPGQQVQAPAAEPAPAEPEE